MVLNPGCKLESPGIFLKSQCPDQPPNQLYGSLWGWAGALVVLKAPQVILVSSQGWKPPAPALLCQLICESKVYKHVRRMWNSVYHARLWDLLHRETMGRDFTPLPHRHPQSNLTSCQGPAQGLPL